jgi:nitroreductase
MPQLAKPATTMAAIHPLLAKRWSPRSFDVEHRLSDDNLLALLEAARWAPSGGNAQPARFLVGRRGDATFTAIAAALSPNNSIWAPDASALIVAVAETALADGSPNPWATYDVGQAVAHLTIEAEHRDLATHQMSGFDAAAVADALGVPDGFLIVSVVAVGRRDLANRLPEMLAERERAARTRRPLDEMAMRAWGEPIERTAPVRRAG